MTARVLAVSCFLLLLLVLCAPDLRRAFGHPLGIAGVSFNYDAVVTHVDANAASAGIRIGDRLDLARATPYQRFGYYGLGTADAGMRVTMPMLRGNTPYVATLVTQPESGERIVMLWVRFAIQVLIALVAALVLLRRPGPATWGFFLLVYIGCAPVNVVYLVGPLWWRTIAINLFWLAGNNIVGNYGAIVFALYLLHAGPFPRWRRVALNVTLGLAALSFATAIWHANALFFAPWPDGRAAILYSTLLILPIFVAPLVLIATYSESSPNLRQRLRWIIGAFLLAALANALDQAGSQGNLGLIQESYVTHSLLTAAASVFITLPVAYAVLKHHIIDLNVAIGRATVFTALSVFILGSFTLVDFFFSHAVEHQGAGLIADVALALVLGFSFNTMHHHVDAFVDRLFFRERHRAEEHVAGVAAAMAYAHSEDHVRSMLTHEPVRAFDLTGARMLSHFDSADEQTKTLAAYVESRRGAVRLTDGQWAFEAAAAVPVFSHGVLDALVLYGLHRNGTDVDNEELTLLERLGSAAGAALDRLEAQSLRRQVAELLQQTREGAIG